ncbi:MAG: MBL fold metallo-hydrolase [Pseudopedobacter saltans]|uniref:MBL fold metallo-hydrolase n=1 Tax=Pseudopedobacter saltans TaxID=151895 RepID=A0A2W5F941_9SPHI|nr:MAG: MBL fold metallo-hydrolase [Pseudopedobacter saltans]
MKISLLFVLLFHIAFSHAQSSEYSYGDIRFKAVNHATFQIWYKGKYYLVDPSVDSSKLKELGSPDYILYTDVHGDHFKAASLDGLALKPTTAIIAPNAVKTLIDDQLPNKHLRIRSIGNGESVRLGKVEIDAIPMYNLTAERLKFHTKGRGNGYVLHLGNSKVYISGDTEDIPEMRQLKDIDVAFVCMNLPYTMDINQAASAVLEFKPKVVIPYHYRGQNGLSDVHAFEKLVNDKDSNIKVELLKWY